MEEIKLGDVVVLNSEKDLYDGALCMTVSEINEEEITCIWRVKNKNEFSTSSFKKHVLTKFEEEE